MNIELEIDWDVFKVAVPLFVAGFLLVAWQAGFITACGITLIGIASGVRKYE